MQQAQIDTLQQEWPVAHAVGRCLHIGCGTKPIAGAVNVDPDPGKRAWADVAALGLRLPFADGTFDSVVSSHVLNLFPDIGAAFAEMARVLKVGGTMAHVVPDWRYTPNHLTSHWPYQRQYSGWHGPQEFEKAIIGIDGLTIAATDFTAFNWAFKVEVTKLCTPIS
jgi:SAM-dependent methyltransferase